MVLRVRSYTGGKTYLAWMTMWHIIWASEWRAPWKKSELHSPQANRACAAACLSGQVFSRVPTVTKDANAHARLGYVRSQSLASTTTSPVETSRLGKLLPTSALKNVGKTKSTPLAKIPADEHIFSPPDDAHRCSSANFRSSSTRPHSSRSPDKCHECVKKGQLHWGELAAPPGNQLIVMMLLLMLLSAQTTVREEK